MIKGLLELKRDGHFYALWATDSRIDVQYEPTGPIVHLGWRRAKLMVATARGSAALVLMTTGRAEKKPPASERSQLAQRAKR